MWPLVSRWSFAVSLLLSARAVLAGVPVHRRGCRRGGETPGPVLTVPTHPGSCVVRKGWKLEVTG